MYTSECISDKDYHDIIKNIRNGYVDLDGITRKPNDQVADILVLEANLGCRIGDIVALRKDSFVCDRNIWKINIVEEKTDKTRTFIIPPETMRFINKIIAKGYSDTDRLFSISTAAVWKAMRICTATLGLYHTSTHGLRKRAAQKLYDSSDGDIAAVCTFLQHNDTKTTTRYLRRSSKHMENSISKIVDLA